MNIQSAIKWAGSKSELAKRLQVSPGAVSHWVSASKIPELQQYKIESLTSGALKASNGK